MNRLIILLTLFCLYSCKRNPCEGVDQNPQTISNIITNEEKALIPYSGSDTLVFVTDQNDSAVFIGTGRNYTYRNKKTTGNWIDCPKDITTTYEDLEIKFIGTKSRIPFIDYWLTTRDPNKAHSSTTIQIYIKEGTASNYLSFVSDSTIWSDSVFFGGKYYYGNEIDGNLNLIYNSEHGILKFKLNDTTWIRTIK